MNLRYLILHNFWLKLISLALASLIWLAVHYQVESERAGSQPRSAHLISQYRTVPISIITKPGDSRVFKITPNEAVALTAGEEEFLNKMPSKDLTLWVDLSDYHAIGNTNEKLYSHAPAQVTIIEIQPEIVTVEQISP